MSGRGDPAGGPGACDARAPASRVTRLHFAGLDHAVVLEDADALCRSLTTVMPGWGLVAAHGPAAAGRAATVLRGGPDGRFAFRSWWADRSLDGLGPAGATCGAVADLIQAFCDARPGTIGLHCGAVRIGGRLVAFTGTYRAGKTTLVTRLGAEPGMALFCDDVLPILPGGEAVALGVQPRLRLPLPDGASPAFRAHVAANLTVRDRRYGFVATARQAPFGTRAPLAALVVLRREEGASARLHRLEASAAASCLIRQNIADPGDAGAHYDRLAALVGGLSRYTLVYSDLEEAVALIRAAFGGDAMGRGVDIGPPLPEEAGAGEAAPPAPLEAVYTRVGDVAGRVLGADTFLWQLDTRAFFRLNPVGGAIWALLEAPVRGQAIAEALCAAFPGAAPGQVAGDVARLLGQMLARGLVARRG